MDTNLTGQQVQGYRIVRRLGSGGYGTVYLGMKEELGKRYQTAIKHISMPDAGGYEAVLRDYAYDKSATQEYFEKMVEEITSEINMLMELSKRDNRYIVAYYDHEIQRHTDPLRYEIFMRMEYLTPLSRHIRQNGMTAGEVVRLGMNMCDALSLCHDSGVMHRDIKEANIFISENGNFKLGDFGVAKSAIETSQAGSIKGTASYMAPEVYRREPYDKSVDIYSLGIVLYKLLNRQRLPFMPDAPATFTAEDKILAETKRLRGEVPPLPANAQDRLGEIIVKACSAKEERYKRAEDFKRDLQALLQTLSKEEYDREMVPQASDGAEDFGEDGSGCLYTQAQDATRTMKEEGVGADAAKAAHDPYARKDARKAGGKKKGRGGVAMAVAAVFLTSAAVAGYWFVSQKHDPLNRFRAAMEEEDYAVAAQLYREKLKNGDVEKLEEAEYLIIGQAGEIKEAYQRGELEYEGALSRLEELKTLGTSDEDDLQAALEEINRLHLSRTAYENAKRYMEAGDYEAAINDLHKVIQEDGNYGDAKKRTAEAIKAYKDGVLASLSEFEPDKRYDEAILTLKVGLLVVPNDADFLAAIADYEKKIENDILLMIDGMIRDASRAVSVSADYAGALDSLRSAGKQYPNSEEIKTAIAEIEEEYLEKVLAEAEAIAAESRYAEAVAALNEGLRLLPNHSAIKSAIAEYEAKYPALLQQMVYFTGQTLANGGQEKDNMQGMQINVIQTSSGGKFDNTYKLEGKYKKLSGVLYQPFEYRSETGVRTLGIYGDGRLLYSASMSGGVEPITFQVDLTGISDFEVSLLNRFTNGSAYARLANVELYQ